MPDNIYLFYFFSNGHPKFGILTLFFIMLPMMYASVVAAIRKVCNMENPDLDDEGKSKQDIKNVCNDKNGLDSTNITNSDKISAKT